MNGNATVCPGGRYGSEPGLGSRECSGLCRGGYYCPDNSTSPEEHECGNVSVYCPAGSGSPLIVAPGEYSVGGWSNETRNSTASCDEGAFCVNGVRELCPAGRYGCSILVSDPLCNGPCVEGFYCPLGSSSGTANSCGAKLQHPASVYCPVGSASPVAVDAGHYATKGSPPDRFGNQSLCEDGSYCEHGVKRSCPVGRYGNVSGLITSNCSGVCEDGYHCPEGSISSQQEQCPAGYYCVSGSIIACPVGRYNEVTAASSLAACLPCPAGTYNSFEGGSSLTSSCVVCDEGEGSVDGSALCWPGVVSAVAGNAPPILPGLTIGDTITITFTKETNQPAVGSGSLSNLVEFTPSVGSVLSGYWTMGGRQLVLRVSDVTGVDVDAAAVVSDVNVTVLNTAGVRDVGLRSPVMPDARLRLSGSWGMSSQPRLLSATAIDVLLVGPGVGVSVDSSGVSDGDRIRLLFDQKISVVDLRSTGAVLGLFSFDPSLPAGVSMRAMMASPTEVDIVFVSFPRLSLSESVGYNVGNLSVQVVGSGNLRSLDQVSTPCNDSLAVTNGSWGDGAIVSVFEKTSTSLRVVMGPPVGMLQYRVEWYVFQWAVDGNFGVLSRLSGSWEDVFAEHGNRSSVDVNVVGDTTVWRVRVEEQSGIAGTVVMRVFGSGSVSYDVAGLTADRPYYVRGGCNNFGGYGPVVASVPVFVTPKGPSLFDVRTSAPTLACAGGDAVRLIGARLGRKGDDVRMKYTNGVYTFESAACDVVIDLVEVVCRSVAGVGTGYSVWVIVDGVSSRVADQRLSYAAPVVTSLTGVGASGGSTRGGDVVVIGGKNFGPVGLLPNPIKYVRYSPIGYEYVFDAESCMLNVSDVEIVCVMGPGVGSRLSWAVNIAGQDSSSGLTHYERPVIERLWLRSESGSLMGVDRLDTRGGMVMVFVGSGFGPVSPSFLSGVSGVSVVDGRVLSGVACAVTVVDSEVECIMPEGVGREYVWSLSVGGQTSNIADVQTSYASPVVSSMLVGGVACGSHVEVPTSGNVNVSIMGDMFGSDRSAVSVLIGGVVWGGRVLMVDAHRFVSFSWPAMEGVSVSVGLSIGGQMAVLPTGCDVVKIGRPVITSLGVANVGSSPMICSSSGSSGLTKLVVFGSNFGFGPQTVVTIDDVACDLVLSESSHTVVTCVTSACSGECAQL